MIRASVLAASLTLPATAQAQPVVWLAVSLSETGYAIEAHAASPTAFTGDALVELERAGAAGTARTRQGQAVTLTPGQAVRLSTLGIGVAPGDRLDVTLTLTAADGTLAARNTLSLPGSAR